MKNCDRCGIDLSKVDYHEIDKESGCLLCEECLSEDAEDRRAEDYTYFDGQDYQS